MSNKKCELLEKIKIPADIKKFSIKQLQQLADEIRFTIIETTGQNGGHLAASLGCVELAIALHFVLDCPVDKIVWDVGHQAYAHKLLTGRFPIFNSLRLFGGISGFPKRDESPYDTFTVGHSSTSIALALGLAKARDLHFKNSRIVAVIGDGALTSGLALEALNNATNINSRLTVVLNDNEMSIAPNVGALSDYLNKLITNPKYNKFKDQIEEMVYGLPKIGQITKLFSKKLQESIKNLVVPKIIFEEFGFRYFGPIDGHNLEDLISILNKVLFYHGPKIIHIRTAKGKGYSFAEKNPSYYHGLGPFDIETGKLKSEGTKISFTHLFGQILIKIAEQDKRIVAISAAMPDGTGLTEFKEKFPERFFDVGITEDFAVTFAAGLASENIKPVVAIYSTFMQRGIDQIFHDILLQKNIAPILALDRAGLVGQDGPTHHGMFDLSYLLMLPNIVITAPSDEFDMTGLLKLASISDMPWAIRYPRGNISGNQIPELNEVNISFGDNPVIMEGSKILILAVGPAALRIKKICQVNTIDALIVNCRFLKPFNEEFLIQLANRFDKIITIEENTVIGGFGAYINILLNSLNIWNKKILNIGGPDRFIEAGDIIELYKTFEFDDDSLLKRINNFICC